MIKYLHVLQAMTINTVCKWCFWVVFIGQNVIFKSGHGYNILL